MTDPLAAYQAAMQQLDQATREASELTRWLTLQIQKLNYWQNLIVANVNGGYPPELALNSQTPSIDANQWPTAQRLSDVLVKWHDAKQAARTAYCAIPESQRAIVTPPPK